MILVCFPRPPATIWHPSMDKSVSVGGVGSSRIHQGTWEDSHPALGLVTLGITVDPAMAISQL